MVVEGTKAAFMALISQRGFAGKYGVDKTVVSQWKKGTRVPTLDKMEEVLTAAGATVVNEKVWEVSPSASGKKEEL
jgi:transcriptional regulator with XRE-family HTH domain